MPEFFEKVVIAFLGPITTVILAALFGQRVSAWWSEKQKRRELELALVGEFYASYGEFCAIWKEWNWLLKALAGEEDKIKASQIILHERACRAEGSIESMLLKISAERFLRPEEAADLGNLRQAFQVLRERIQEGSAVSYGYSSHPDYLEFKRLATLLGNMLVMRAGSPPNADIAYKNFVIITDNVHERRWRLAGRN